MTLHISSVFTYDEDAGNYIQAVETADGQALESATRKAINNFVIGCKQDGIWNAIKASCILAGARTLNGALQPLAGTAPTNYNFVAGDYDRKTGLKGNGSTKYLDSNRAGTDDPNTSGHMAVYATDLQLNGALIGYYQASPASFGYLYTTIGTGTNFSLKTNNQAQNIGTLGPGFYGVRKAGVVAGKIDARLNGADYSSTYADTASPSLAYHVFKRNYNSTSSDLYSRSRLAFYSIGESLDLALLDGRVTDLISKFQEAIP